jgi:hypothetical protein
MRILLSMIAAVGDLRLPFVPRKRPLEIRSGA